nr:hypothetical protein [Burkholderia sp. TSV86]
MSSSWIALYFLRHDPALVACRQRVDVKAEREPLQKIVLGIATVESVAFPMAAGIEWRFAHTPLDWAAVLIGNGLVAAGFVPCFFTLRENSFASSAIEVSREQTVVPTRPYGPVRHPLYSRQW